VIVALFSLGAFWTIFIPYLLIPLPYQVFKRNFSFTLVQAALVMLPIGLYMTSVYVESDEAYDNVLNLLIASLPFVIALFFVLRSPSMQRWGKPIATLPKFAARHQPENLQPEPVSFYVDHAPQDRVLAEDLSSALQEFGHPQVEQPDQAEAVFTVVSRFKINSIADSQKQVVYPVILQTTDDMDQSLWKVQWIDFRGGVRNLDALAQLLPNPAKLLESLGIRPMGNQLIVPPIIRYLIYLIIALAIFTLGSWLPYIIQFLPDILDYSDADSALVMLVINLILFVALSVFMTRVIIRRSQPWATHLNMFITMLVLGALILWQYLINDAVLEAFGVYDSIDDFRGFSADFPPIIYVVGNILMFLFVLWKRADMKRWFPARVKKLK
jgi:hypothetical protein